MRFQTRPGPPRMVGASIPQVAVCLVLSSGIGAAIALTHPTPQVALIAAIAATCLAPLLSRVRRGQFDLFEPIVLANVALAVMYVARPWALLADSEPDVFKGYDLAATTTEALVVALVSVLSLQLGYGLAAGQRVAARLSRPPRLRSGPVIAVSITFALTAILLFSAFLVQSGGLSVVFDLIKGRSGRQNSYFADSSAYLYAAPELLWPASLLIFALGIAERRRRLILMGVLILLPLGVLSGGRGSRILLLPLMLSPIVLFYIYRGQRPRLIPVFLACYVIFTVGFSFFRETRTIEDRVSRGHELAKAVTQPNYEFRQLFIHGVDNDMFVSLGAELSVVPEQLKRSPFDFAFRTLAKPIPRQLWNGKPLSPEEHLTDTLYPGERFQARNSSSAGVTGSFYLAGGLAGVVLGMVLVGWLLRLSWEYVMRFPGDLAAALLLSSGLMFIPILLRGGVGDTLARALFGFGPLLVALRLSAGSGARSERRPGRASTRAR